MLLPYSHQGIHHLSLFDLDQDEYKYEPTAYHAPWERTVESHLLADSGTPALETLSVAGQVGRAGVRTYNPGVGSHPLIPLLAGDPQPRCPLNTRQHPGNDWKALLGGHCIAPWSRTEPPGQA